MSKDPIENNSNKNDKPVGGNTVQPRPHVPIVEDLGVQQAKDRVLQIIKELNKDPTFKTIVRDYTRVMTDPDHNTVRNSQDNSTMKKKIVLRQPRDFDVDQDASVRCHVPFSRLSYVLQAYENKVRKIIDYTCRGPSSNSADLRTAISVFCCSVLPQILLANGHACDTVHVEFDPSLFNQDKLRYTVFVKGTVEAHNGMDKTWVWTDEIDLIGVKVVDAVRGVMTEEWSSCYADSMAHVLGVAPLATALAAEQQKQYFQKLHQKMDIAYTALEDQIDTELECEATGEFGPARTLQAKIDEKVREELDNFLGSSSWTPDEKYKKSVRHVHDLKVLVELGSLEMPWNGQLRSSRRHERHFVFPGYHELGPKYSAHTEIQLGIVYFMSQAEKGQVVLQLYSMERGHECEVRDPAVSRVPELLWEKVVDVTSQAQCAHQTRDTWTSFIPLDKLRNRVVRLVRNGEDPRDTALSDMVAVRIFCHPGTRQEAFDYYFVRRLQVPIT